jgi:predicted nucleotidyltransferase
VYIIENDMIDPKVHKKIVERLNQIENDEDAKILYACESGSRAWGFPSIDSDYDVRFIYVRKTEWYLSLGKKRDVIEIEIDNDLDISGWDLNKALLLFYKSNPPLFEWLDSPIVYMEKYSAIKNLRKLISDFYSPISAMYHYRNMAEKNIRAYLKYDKVLLKKYFYVLRPLLACLWIEKDLGPVPIKFQTLVNHIIDEGPLLEMINLLIQKKSNVNELSWDTRIPEINNFIDREMKRIRNKNLKSIKIRPDLKKLDQLFVNCLSEIWQTKI